MLAKVVFVEESSGSEKRCAWVGQGFTWLWYPDKLTPIYDTPAMGGRTPLEDASYPSSRKNSKKTMWYLLCSKCMRPRRSPIQFHRRDGRMRTCQSQDDNKKAPTLLHNTVRTTQLHLSCKEIPWCGICSIRQRNFSHWSIVVCSFTGIMVYIERKLRTTGCSQAPFSRKCVSRGHNLLDYLRTLTEIPKRFLFHNKIAMNHLCKIMRL